MITDSFNNFTIVDTDDQIRLIKNICKSENIDIKKLSPRFILAIIDRWKNNGYYPNEVKINRKVKSILTILRINTEIEVWDQNKRRLFEFPKIELQ